MEIIGSFCKYWVKLFFSIFGIVFLFTLTSMNPVAFSISVYMCLVLFCIVVVRLHLKQFPELVKEVGPMALWALLLAALIYPYNLWGLAKCLVYTLLYVSLGIGILQFSAVAATISFISVFIVLFWLSVEERIKGGEKDA